MPEGPCCVGVQVAHVHGCHHCQSPLVCCLNMRKLATQSFYVCMSMCNTFEAYSIMCHSSSGCLHPQEAYCGLES